MKIATFGANREKFTACGKGSGFQNSLEEIDKYIQDPEVNLTFE